jgi:YegS/Rv2252/BmrU family lipid kinase
MIAVILNPVSGGGKGIRLLPKVTATLQTLARPFTIHVTTGPGDATAAARHFACEGAELILAVGGDGTLNEVANGMLAITRTIPMGLISSGHGCDFVRTSGSPRDVATAIRACHGGKVRAIDVGRVTTADGSSRVFLNVAGLGFDANVAERVLTMRLPGSTLPYLVSVASELRRYRNIHVVIDADGRQISGKATSVLVANARYFAGGMQIAPMADITDGLLDVAILGDFGKVDLVRNVPNVYRGKHTTHPKFMHFPAKSIRVECIEPARVQVDGELAGYAPATFTVEPGALMLAG